MFFLEKVNSSASGSTTAVKATNLTQNIDLKDWSNTRGVRKVIQGATRLNIETEATTDSVKAHAKLAGRLEAVASNLGELIEYKRQIMEHGNTIYQHAVTHKLESARQAIKFQGQNKRLMQGLSPQFAKMEFEQEHHNGYAEFLSEAEKHLTF